MIVQAAKRVRKKRLFLTNCWITVALLFLLNPLIASGVPQETTGRQYKVKVLYRITDVVVKDSAGNYVRGLGPTDFILEVDKKRTDIKSVDEFQTVLLEDERIRNYLAQAADAEARGEESPPAPTQPRFIVFVFDRFNMGYHATHESINSAIEIVEKGLLPYDKVAVCLYNGTLRVLTGPTTDKEKILSAIEAANIQSGNPNYRPDINQIMSPETNQADSSETSGQGNVEVDPRRGLRQTQLTNRTGSNAERMAGEIQLRILLRNYIQSLKFLANSLEALPGRKTYLLFSEGISGFQADNPETQSFVQKQLSELSRTVSASNSSLYTIRRGPLQPEWILGTDADIDVSEVGADASVLSAFQDIHSNRLDSLRILADLSNGRFFDAGVSDPDLLGDLREEVGNYYLLGFLPPKGDKGRYHKIKIRAANPTYKVVHRTGFFEPKSVSRMSDEERAIHLEEGFLIPGAYNELGFAAHAFPVPAGGGPEALVAVEIDSGELGELKKGRRELEMVINVEDAQGRIRYRAHKIFSTSRKGSFPPRLWLTENVPVVPEGCAVFLALRDNATGKRATWKGVVRDWEPRHAGVPVLVPILLTLEDKGGLAEWKSETVNDGVKPVAPLTPSGFQIPGRLILDYTVAQGGEVGLMVFAGGLAGIRGFSKESISVAYTLDPDAEAAYSLAASKETLDFDGKQEILSLTASVPIGLAQQEEGILFVKVSGIPGHKPLSVGLPYRISAFEKARAEELLSDSRISRIPAN